LKSKFTLIGGYPPGIPITKSFTELPTMIVLVIRWRV